MTTINFYEANVSILCVDGAVEGIISNCPRRLMEFLAARDHEGSSISMVVRDTPDSGFREVNDPDQVYKELQDARKNSNDY